MKTTTLTEIPEFAKRPKAHNLILENNAPIFVRSDGRTGDFYHGTTALGSELEIQVLEWRWIKESRWGTPGQYWLDCCFANPEGKVCVMSLRKSGAVNLAAAFADLRNQPNTQIALHALWLRLGFVEQQVLGDSLYYVVDVLDLAWATEIEYDKAQIFLEDFADSKPALWVIPGDLR